MQNFLAAGLSVYLIDPTELVCQRPGNGKQKRPRFMGSAEQLGLKVLPWLRSRTIVSDPLGIKIRPLGTPISARLQQKRPIARRPRGSCIFDLQGPGYSRCGEETEK